MLDGEENGAPLELEGAEKGPASPKSVRSNSTYSQTSRSRHSVARHSSAASVEDIPDPFKDRARYLELLAERKMKAAVISAQEAAAEEVCHRTCIGSVMPRCDCPWMRSGPGREASLGREACHEARKYGSSPVAISSGGLGSCRVEGDQRIKGSEEDREGQD
jgi:hypothetical protein